MRRSLLTAAVVLLAITPAAAVDAIGTIRWIDVDRCATGPVAPVRRCVLSMLAGGQDRQVRFENDVRVLDRDGRPLPGGLRSPELKPGVEITVTLEGAGHLMYPREDLLEDGTHPSDSGGRKVANMLMAFFRTDPLARTWYVRR